MGKTLEESLNETADRVCLTLCAVGIPLNS